jgi:hypothetical protein
MLLLQVVQVHLPRMTLMELFNMMHVEEPLPPKGPTVLLLLSLAVVVQLL